MRRTRLITTLTAVALLAPAVGCGCAQREPAEGAGGYETVAAEPGRDRAAADRHNADAVRHMGRGDYGRAEASLKSALAADVMHGPAHNNLGKVYYHQGKLYLAAWEFQYASKLMPGVAEPRNNLGMVFEAAGKLDDAVGSYEEARGLQPDNPQFLGNLARARVRRGDRGPDVRALLERLVMVETRPAWSDWARRQLAGMSMSPASE